MHSIPPKSVPQITITESEPIDSPTSPPYRFTRFHRSSHSCRRSTERISHLENEHFALDNDAARINLSRNNSVQSPSLLPPNVLEDDLDMLGLIGVGAFGRAIKARHRKYGCLLVVKEVLRENKDDEDALLREICLLRHLRHPNILTCIGVLVRNRKICLVTEYVDRGSLHEVLLHSAPNRLDWLKRVSFGKDIATGMAFLHDKDVIHRDLTTHNCLVRQDDSVVVSDFGLSKMVLNRSLSPPNSEEDTNHLTVPASPLHGEVGINGTRRRMGRSRRHTVVGNPFWMAPEMLSGKPYDHRVDVYSFGVILCQLIACCDADPDELPRNSKHFGVEMDEFVTRYRHAADTAPTIMLETARSCVVTDATLRPSFQTCQEWLNECIFYLMTGRDPPEKILLAAKSGTM